MILHRDCTVFFVLIFNICFFESIEQKRRMNGKPLLDCRLLSTIFISEVQNSNESFMIWFFIASICFVFLKLLLLNYQTFTFAVLLNWIVSHCYRYKPNVAHRLGILTIDGGSMHQSHTNQLVTSFFAVYDM